MLKSFLDRPQRRSEILKTAGRAFLVIIPMIAVMMIVGLVVWSFRRQTLTTETVAEPTEEPTYEVPPEPITT